MAWWGAVAYEQARSGRAGRLGTRFSRAVAWVIDAFLIVSPGLVPLIIYAVSESLLVHATVFKFDIGLTDGDVVLGAAVAGQEARARYVLASCLLLLACMCTVAIAASWRIAYDNCRIEAAWDDNAKRRVVLTSALAGVLAVLVLWRAWDDPTRLYEYVGRNIFPDLVMKYFSGQSDLRFDVVRILPLMFTFTSTAAIVAGVSLAVSGGTFLAGFDAFEKKSPTVDDLKAFAARRMTRLKTLLIVASACFVAGILQLQAWQAWPLSLMTAGSSVATQYEKLTEGMTIYAGTRFALVLFAILVTAQFGLRVRATAVFDRCRQPAGGKVVTRDEFLKEAGLDITIPETLKSAFTVIAPMIVGPLAALLQSVGESLS